MLHEILLVLHVAAGSAGLVLGPVALWRSGGRRPLATSPFGRAYVWCVLGVSLTAVGLVSLDWSKLWWFAVLAIFSSALALLAFLAPKLRFRAWTRACARGEGGSYIALVTALLVVSVDGRASLLAWILPTLVGVPLIRLRAARLGGGIGGGLTTSPVQPSPRLRGVGRYR